jgi:hypothetical protein
VTAPDHPFLPDLTGPPLARHLGGAHHYYSSSYTEDFDATHRRLHGVPSVAAERRQAELAKAWDEGYDAGSADQEAFWLAKAAGPDTVENLRYTDNPYATESEPVSTVPAQTNPELWRD